MEAVAPAESTARGVKLRMYRISRAHTRRRNSGSLPPTLTSVAHTWLTILDARARPLSDSSLVFELGIGLLESDDSVPWISPAYTHSLDATRRKSIRSRTLFTPTEAT